MMLRGEGGQEERRAVLSRTLSSVPRAHQGDIGVTDQESTREHLSMWLWELHGARLSFPLLQGTIGHCSRTQVSRPLYLPL